MQSERRSMEILGFGIIVLVFFAVFFISGMWNEKKAFRLYKEKLVKEYGTENKREWKREEYSHVDGYFRRHAQGFYLDDITWNDLNMDDIFKQIDMLEIPWQQIDELYRNRK